MKRLQNKISESYLALPVTSAYAAGVWVFCGLFQEKPIIGDTWGIFILIAIEQEKKCSNEE